MVDRRWPRGCCKEALGLAAWLEEVAERCPPKLDHYRPRSSSVPFEYPLQRLQDGSSLAGASHPSPSGRGAGVRAVSASEKAWKSCAKALH
ncbi:hypothetical protein [Pseudomonas sp. OTU5201]|uniref:hypothetical protein n=1 Tax=Pseudomonas sp. OTU5201 TaxID=3043850 RepID=UPI00406C5A6C